MKTFFAIIGSLLGLVFLVFFLNALGLVSFSFFAPKMENARREVFENTQSFIHGKAQEISKYRLEYETAKDEQYRESLRRAILRAASDVDLDKLPMEVSAFVQKLRYQPIEKLE